MITAICHHLPAARRLAGSLLIFVALVHQAEARTVVHAMTGRTLDRAAIVRTLPQANLGDVLYAEVNSEWLAKFYRTYRAELSRMGVVKWSDRYDCRRFAGFFTELAQNQFFNQAFQSSIPAHTLALGPVWYQKADGKGHAIVVALTERGVIYLDPQNGQELNLTATERASIYFAVM